MWVDGGNKCPDILYVRGVQTGSEMVKYLFLIWTISTECIAKGIVADHVNGCFQSMSQNALFKNSFDVII